MTLAERATSPTPQQPQVPQPGRSADHCGPVDPDSDPPEHRSEQAAPTPVGRSRRTTGRPPFWRRGPQFDWPWVGYEPADPTGVTERAVWFGPADRPLFGWLSFPTDAASSLGVLLCPPIGEEARSTHRTYRRLGVELARRGMVALRVDYDASGDSAGGQRDPDRVAAWRRSMVDAAAELRGMGLTEVAVVGMRLGATLAADVAGEAGFGSVVLWDPCSSGRAFLREGSALHLMAGYPATASDQALVETPGFAYTTDTADELGRLGLADLPGEPWCERLLVLTRSGEPLRGRPAAGLRGAHVEWDHAHGQRELLEVEPSEARTPHPTITRICTWLQVAADRTAASPFTPTDRTEVVVTDPASGARVRERIVEVGPDRLFGIVSEPLRCEPNTPWIVMINIAIESHVGPGRRWVEYGRAWAGQGLRSIRFDQGGTGNSPVAQGQTEDRIFDPRWLQDTPNVIDSLEPEAPVVLFGVCSGAYSALEAAMRRPIDAAYLVSAGFANAWFARGQPAYSPDRLAGRRFAAPLAAVFHRNTRLAFALWRIFYQVLPHNAPMSVIKGVLDRNITVRLVCNRQDAFCYREALWWSVVRRRAITRTKRFALVIEPSLEHSLMTQWSQDFILADATEFFRSRYGPATAGQSR